jgi:hypothetical protein
LAQGDRQKAGAAGCHQNAKTRPHSAMLPNQDSCLPSYDQHGPEACSPIPDRIIEYNDEPI